MNKRIVFLCLLIGCFFLPITTRSEAALPKEPGTYPVETTYVEEGKKLQKTVYVTVKSEDTVMDGGVAIDAKNFFMTTKQAETITAKQAIAYSEAKAWSTVDGSEKVITLIDLSAIRPVAGVYHATFATREGISKTVNVTVDEALLGNNELNRYENTFNTNYWRFVLTLGVLLVLVLLTPIVIVLFSSRNIIQVVNQLIEIFSK